MPVKTFKAILAEAAVAANAAGDAWMAEATKRGPAFNVINNNGRVVGQLLDVCGIVYLRCTDKRTTFGKWVAKQNGRGGAYVTIPHKYRMRQEMGLLEACEGAALKVLNDNGIQKVMLYSNID